MYTNSIKHGRNIYDKQISDEFDYGPNQTRTNESYSPMNWKIC